MNSVRPIEPPTVLFASEEFSRTIPASLDAGWSFAEEAAATDGALMGNPDAKLGDFPPGATDAEIATLVDEFTDVMCRPQSRARRPSRRR